MDPFEIVDLDDTPTEVEVTGNSLRFQACYRCRLLIARSDAPCDVWLGEKRMCRSCVLAIRFTPTQEELADRAHRQEAFLALFGDDAQTWEEMINANRR